jgi:hypothetical protein
VGGGWVYHYLKGSEMSDDLKKMAAGEWLTWPVNSTELNASKILEIHTVATKPEVSAAERSLEQMLSEAWTRAATSPWIGLDYAAPEPELVNIRQLIAGAVYDFAGRLTTGSAMQVGSAHNAAPMAEACEAFLRDRGCSDGEPMVKDWNEAITALELSGDVESKQETTDALRSAVIHAVNLRGFDQQACNEIADDVLGQMGL